MYNFDGAVGDKRIDRPSTYSKRAVYKGRKVVPLGGGESSDLFGKLPKAARMFEANVSLEMLPRNMKARQHEEFSRESKHGYNQSRPNPYLERNPFG